MASIVAGYRERKAQETGLGHEWGHTIKIRNHEIWQESISLGLIGFASKIQEMKNCIVSFILLTILIGCTSQQKLMVAPEIYADGIIDPFQQTPKSAQTTITPVFVVSARNLTGNKNPAKFYDDDRSRVLRLGIASIEIGENMTWRQLRSESLANQRPENPRIRVLEVDDFGPLWTTFPPPDMGFDRDYSAPEVSRAPADRFVFELDNELTDSSNKELYIFVHGFNTEFTHNLGIAAELWHYLGRGGAIISYAWPSKQSLFEYTADKANAEYATRLFRKLLAFLAEYTDASHINIVAHSAGSPIVVNALKQLRLIHFYDSKETVQKTYRIGKVVLAAPDMDLLQFINASLDGFDEIPKYVAVYGSDRDEALSLSRIIFGERPLGSDSSDALTPQEVQALKRSRQQLQAIDVSYAQKKYASFLGHSYFHRNPWVSSDVALLFKYNMSPQERGLVQNDNGFWVFPKDYPLRLKRAISERP